MTLFWTLSGMAVVFGVYLYFVCWVCPARPSDLFDDRSPPGDVPYIPPRAVLKPLKRSKPRKRRVK